MVGKVVTGEILSGVEQLLESASMVEMRKVKGQHLPGQKHPTLEEIEC